MSSYTSISSEKLSRLVGTVNAPTLIDEDFAASCIIGVLLRVAGVI